MTSQYVTVIANQSTKPPDGGLMVATVVFTMTVDGTSLGTFKAPVKPTVDGEYGVGNIEGGAARCPGSLAKMRSPERSSQATGNV